MKPKNSACFLFGATGKEWTKNGNAIIGSVSDDPYDVRTFMRSMYQPGNYAHLGSELVSTTENTLTERGYFARPGETTRGINEVGLAFTCAMVIENDELEKPEKTTHYADVTEKMMRSCETIEDAISLFQSIEYISPAYTVLLADSSGGLAQLEVGNFGVQVFQHYSVNNPGAVFSVNCYQTEQLKTYNAPVTQLSNLENNNAVRLNRGKTLAEDMKGDLGRIEFARILTDHQNIERDSIKNPFIEAWGYSICNHGTRSKDDFPFEDLPWGTVSSEILEPAEGLFWYAYGWPCGEEPEHGDQIYQQNSWGCFLPFVLQSPIQNTEAVIELTTPEGEVCPQGIAHMASFKPIISNDTK